MTKDEFQKLETGDVIRHVDPSSVFGHAGYVVCAAYGDHVVAVHVVNAMNPEEWDVIAKVTEWSLS